MAAGPVNDCSWRWGMGGGAYWHSLRLSLVSGATHCDFVPWGDHAASLGSPLDYPLRCISHLVSWGGCCGQSELYGMGQNLSRRIRF